MPKNIADLRRARRAAADTMQAAADRIAALEEQDSAPAPEAMAAATADFEAAQASFATAQAAVQRAEAVEAAQAAAAVGDGDPAPIPVPGMPAAAQDPALKGVGFGFAVQALARNRGDRERAVADLDRAGHSAISAALSGASEAAGGVTVPQPLATEVIDLLRARSVVRAAGTRTFPMPAGEMRRAKLLASATASYGAENAVIAASEQSFGALDQSFKKLTALVPIGNSLLRHSGVGIAQVVRDDMLSVMALREDLAFLRGPGDATSPKGLRSWIPAANWTASVAATAAASELALRRLVSRVEDADVPMVAPRWIMRASAKNWLASLKDGVGLVLFPSIQANGTLFGYPISTTSQIPDNLGTGGNETEIYFGDFNEAMIGDSMVLTIGVSSEAAYVNDGGDLVSAFANDLTLMRAISEHDFAPAHDEAFAGFSAAGWSI